MDIFLNILFLVIGMVLLIKGADFFVDGASAVARRFKVPAMFIGLTIIALGTSLPELSVSVASAIKGSTDMSAGNIVGSNMANILLILGLVAVIKPVPLTQASKKIDFPFLMGVTALLLIFCADSILEGSGMANIVGRTESLVLLATLAIYMTILILNAKKERAQVAVFEGANKVEPIAPTTKTETQKAVKANAKTATKNVEETAEEVKEQPKEEKKEKELKIWQIILYIVLGLAGVVFGAECVCTTAQFLALKMGMSEALVGLTIVAIGTSLPELTTSIIAARKGENELALGNVIGSNIMNIALILGVVGVIKPVPVSTTILTDMAILFVFTTIFSILCMTSKKSVSRTKGAIFIAMYFAYLTFAIVRNYCF